MNRRTTSIARNPILNDFIYTILYNASYEQKRGLMGKYFKASVNQRSAKTFVTNSTRDEKEYIMSMLGFEFFYVVAKRGTTMKKMKELLEKFENKKQVSAVKEIADAGLFVMGDAEFIRLLGLMSKSIHHPTYFLNMEIQRQGYNIHKWEKRALIEKDLQVREVDECGRMLAKTVLNANVAMDYSPGTTGMNKNPMKILLYLYYKSQLEVTDEALQAHFLGNISKTEFRYAIKELMGAEMLIRTDDKVYMIAGRGIKAVNDFMNSVSKLNEL